MSPPARVKGLLVRRPIAWFRRKARPRRRKAPPVRPHVPPQSAQLHYVSDATPGIRRRRSGHSFRYIGPHGAPIRVPYVLVDASVKPVGRVVAADRLKGVFLWRLQGPLRLRTLVHGLYDDTWSGPRVTYLRRGCAGGTLDVLLQGDVSLLTRPSVVTVRSSPVSRFLTRTVAPRTTAPFGSVTVPLNCPEVPCARRGTTSERKAQPKRSAANIF